MKGQQKVIAICKRPTNITKKVETTLFGNFKCNIVEIYPPKTFTNCHKLLFLVIVPIDYFRVCLGVYGKLLSRKIITP